MRAGRGAAVDHDTLRVRIDAWTQAGIISPEQAARILAHEAPSLVAP